MTAAAAEAEEDFCRAAKRRRTQREAAGEREGERGRSAGGGHAERSALAAASGASGSGERSGFQMPPSPVVHLRGLSKAAVEADLVEVLHKFGDIRYVAMMPSQRQALVEFASVEDAQRCVEAGSREPTFIVDQQAFFNFSSSQRISRPGGAQQTGAGTKVLLLSIQNPLYPITTEVLHRVCEPIGRVARIAIFKRQGVQAMVEFESVEDAQRAKLHLNGADIYNSCCTMKIEYARPTRLNIVRNDHKTWDYSRPTAQQPGLGMGKQRRGAILGEHPSNSPPRPLLSPPPSGCVLMVRNLHMTKMNCNRVFNLFCLYGGVVKVKFLKSVPEAALVQMDDAFSAERAAAHLHSLQLFDRRLSISASEQASVLASGSFQLCDGSSSFADFSRSRNNGGRSAVQPPAALLHFYNAPPATQRQHLLQLCAQHHAPHFNTIRLFDHKPGSRTVSGLLEFGSRQEAVETLTLLNHQLMRTSSGSSPFTLKLCFSTSFRL